MKECGFHASPFYSLPASTPGEDMQTDNLRAVNWRGANMTCSQLTQMK